jgi:transcriptional regulator with XRE-family HTH domain
LRLRNSIAKVESIVTYFASQLRYSNHGAAVLENKGFDGDAYYRALEAVVQAKSKSWKEVAAETGVSASTLTRMSQGRKPDASSLAALSAWAELNPSDFVRAPFKKTRPAPLSQISALLRADPNLDTQAAEAVEAIVRAAYDRLRKPDQSS